MSESGVFACPTCGASLSAPGGASEIKCQFCGSTVIVPEELRPLAPPPDLGVPSTIVVEGLAPAVATVGGIVGLSFILPIVLTFASICVMIVVILFVTNQVSSAVRGAFIVPTSINAAVLTEVAKAPSRAPATATRAPTGTPAATGTPVHAPTPFTRVVLKDNFADPSSGWDHGVFDGNTLAYVSGGYRMLVAKDNSGQTSWIKDGLADVSVEVDGRQTAGPAEGWFGVLCRAQKGAGAYGFMVSSTSRYEVLKYTYSAQGSRNVTLERGTLQSGLLSRATPVHIRADCIGSALTLNVNGHTVTVIKDGDYAMGGVGLVAETGPGGGAGVDILFSNFIVTGP